MGHNNFGAVSPKSSYCTSAGLFGSTILGISRFGGGEFRFVLFLFLVLFQYKKHSRKGPAHMFRSGPFPKRWETPGLGRVFKELTHCQFGTPAPTIQNLPIFAFCQLFLGRKAFLGKKCTKNPNLINPIFLRTIHRKLFFLGGGGGREAVGGGG